MNRATLIQRFAELDSAPPELVDSAIAQADRMVADTFGILREDMIALRAAQFCALSPHGRDARLSSVAGKTVYDDRIQEMIVANGCGRFRLA